jgi:hypothetical protein
LKKTSSNLWMKEGMRKEIVNNRRNPMRKEMEEGTLAS